MSNVIPLYRNTVQEVIDEVSELRPDTIVAFTMKNGEFRIHASNIEGVTQFVGALERVKFELLQGQA
jgi:hypothetical protein